MIFTDRITFWSALRLLIARAIGSMSGSHPGQQVIYCLNGRIDRCWPLLVLKRVYGTRVVCLEYALSEVVRPDGEGGILLRIYAHDCSRLCEEIVQTRVLRNPIFRRLCSRFVQDRILLYYKKRITEELVDPLRQIHVVAWQHRQSRGARYCTLYAQSTLWRREIEQFAERENVRVVWYSEFDFGGIWALFEFVRKLNKLVRGVLVFASGDSPNRSRKSEALSDVEPTIAVAYDGKGITLDLSKNSDLFWVPFVDRSRSRILVYFHRPDDPLDSVKAAYLDEYDLDYAIWNDAGAADGFSGQSIDSNNPFFVRLSVWLIAGSLGGLRRPCTSCWMLVKSLQFLRTYAMAYGFYRARNVRVLVGFSETHDRIILDQAVHDVDGISVTYQRSAVRLAGPAWFSSSHAQFLFSSNRFQTELQGRFGSRYLLASGYTHDHAFARVRQSAAELRERLYKAGARFVVCFLDENTCEDARLGLSRLESARDYIFLCTRLIEDSELGIILKPKKATTLSTRVGPYMGELLSQALKTGRCILIEEGIVATPTLPCEVTQASDVAIGLLLGTTAALESRLAGTPTVLLDHDHLIHHPLRSSGVVYGDWDSLWSALSTHRDDPSACRSFGVWSSVAEFDTYCDGRAAERIGSYLTCFLEALDQGEGRDTALEISARAYGDRWGYENVLSVDAFR